MYLNYRICLGTPEKALVLYILLFMFEFACADSINGISFLSKFLTSKFRLNLLKSSSKGIVEARGSMSSCQIYFSFFSETIHTTLKNKKNTVLEFLGKIFG